LFQWSLYVKLIQFRGPNFELTADIMYWLVKSYDPSFELSTDLGTEEQRVHFVKSVATFMAPKAQISLNTKKIYMADGYAVKELMKIADLLYRAKYSTVDVNESVSNAPLDISNKVNKLKECRNLASAITEKGAELYDLLGRELQLRVLCVDSGYENKRYFSTL
jgi:clusterin-associated protein 1